MLTNILIAVGMSCALGTAFNNANANNFINNDIPNNVIYDDENSSITLSVDELNNYTWQNLYNNADNSSITISYNDYDFTWQSNNNGYITFLDTVEAGYQFVLYNQSQTITIDEVEVNKLAYSFTYDEMGSYQNFSYTAVITTSEYESIKASIELDIQANSNTTPTAQDFVSILGDMIGLLTGGLTGFATGIGTGIQTLVSSLFIASNGTSLSVFGAVICIFGGIALAIGLSRLIFQWIASIGAKH